MLKKTGNNYSGLIEMDTTVKNKIKKSPNFSFLSEHSKLTNECAIKPMRYIFYLWNSVLIKLYPFFEQLTQEMGTINVDIFSENNTVIFNDQIFK